MFNRKTFKTLEFLLVVLSNGAAWIATLADYIDPRYAIYTSAVSGALYALWRGLAKLNADTKDYWHTTEFWLALAASAPAIIGAFDGVIDAHTYGILQGLIVALLGIGAGIRKNPEVATGNLSALDVEGETELFVPDEDPGIDNDDRVVGAGQPLPDEG